MELNEIINNTLKEYLNENSNLIKDYVFDKSRLNDFIQNARKWKENDFIEEYIALNDINIIIGYEEHVDKGDKIIMVRDVRDGNGKYLYKTGIQVHAYYKTVIANKDYGNSYWDFIMDNTKELQREAKILYHQNKNNKKPKINKNEKTIKGYHASPKKFNQFKYGEHSESGQLGADYGFFFFKHLKNAQDYAGVIKHYNDKSYIYECTIRLGNYEIWKGENVGTNWGRIGDLEQAVIEGFDVIIIENADTGYGITDEIIVFDDDNIKIDKFIEL